MHVYTVMSYNQEDPCTKMNAGIIGYPHYVIIVHNEVRIRQELFC